MEKNKLIIFKKPTDAVGPNRGFIYQYLKTLVLWINNYRHNKNMNIYCEVEDDIKESEENLKNINYTQLKCYGAVLSLKHEDVKKSLYNFFILFLMNDDYEGVFAFETNTSISRNDKLLSKWSLEAGRLDLHPDLMEESISKTKEILLEELEKAKITKESSLRKNIKDNQKKIPQEKNSAKIEEYRGKIDKWETELEEYFLYLQELKAEIMDNENLKNFVNRVEWEFKRIKAEDSLKVLEAEALSVLRNILRAENDPNIYFCRLLTEVSKKATNEEESERMLNNDLFEQILKETDDEIKERISKELMEEWEKSLREGFNGVHGHLDKLEKKIDELGTINPQRSYLEEYAFVGLPHKEEEVIQAFLYNEKNDHQSKLKVKIDNMENTDLDTKISFLEMGTEYRCRYLIYLEELHLNSSNAYSAIKKLETKVQLLCTRHTMALSKASYVDSNDVYLELQDKLEALLEEFNFEMVKNGIKIDSDIVTGQMFHMAAKCSLKWHKEARIG
ncbi:hypothetical protein [Priestia sp. YIM B13489]|uniref:hypothetical protein n=1 Tax=Priestia sp. YIM B13489 TaxID=3366313 RepID=UPI00366E0353